MPPKSRVDQTIDLLLDQLLDGEYDSGQPLPPEKNLASRLDVSRLTLREAISVLRAYGVLEVLRGKGTYIREFKGWSATTPIISAIVRREKEPQSALDLMGCRRMIEIGAITEFAVVRSDYDLERMEMLYVGLEAAKKAEDIETFASRDIEFHNVFIYGCNNAFVSMILRPISEQLYMRRMQTSSNPAIRERAQIHHRNILDALILGNSSQCIEALNAHLDQTSDDLMLTIRQSSGVLKN